MKRTEPVTIRQAQDAALLLGDEADEILGPGGLSGADQAALRRLVNRAAKRSHA